LYITISPEITPDKGWHHHVGNTEQKQLKLLKRNHLLPGNFRRAQGCQEHGGSAGTALVLSTLTLVPTGSGEETLA